MNFLISEQDAEMSVCVSQLETKKTKKHRHTRLAKLSYRCTLPSRMQAHYGDCDFEVKSVYLHLLYYRKT